MNDFEKAIENCPYSTDWFEMRNYMAHICESFIQKPECEWYHIYEKELGQTKFRSIVFYIYNFLYVWTDAVVDGEIESSQLDKPYNDVEATVLYCNVENGPQFASILFQWIDKGEITQIC